jgi:phosphopantothenoylcysteine decarboxylase/phosphopantothenate--cysteine ligase
MNTRMWRHPATQANAEALRARGVELIGPDEGELAEGEWGVGRMAEPEQIFARCEALVRADAGSGGLHGKRVVVTAGGTREPLDPVRFVGNRSSGRMGVALASEARRRGAEVTLLAANLAVPVPPGIQIVETPTAGDMARETLARGDADLVLMAAAVADYRPVAAETTKRPKDSELWEVALEPTVDILAELSGQPANGRILVGFAAETGAEGVARAREKLTRKGADLIVYNDVGRSDVGFDAEENEVVLLTDSVERRIPKAPKERIASEILDRVEQLVSEASGPAGRR